MDVKMPQNAAAVAPIGIETDRAGPLAENRELIQAVHSVNNAELLGQDNELSYQLDREAHRLILRIVNRKTNEVIEQIPEEYVLQLVRELRRQSG